LWVKNGNGYRTGDIAISGPRRIDIAISGPRESDIAISGPRESDIATELSEYALCSTRLGARRCFNPSVVHSTSFRSRRHMSFII